MTQRETVSRSFGPNEWLVDEMYEQFVADPASVSESWREFFADYKRDAAPPAPAAPVAPAAPKPAAAAPTQAPAAPAPAAEAKPAPAKAAEPAAAKSADDAPKAEVL